MIKACIVGCGKIADAHAWAISETPGAELAGACDREELMAGQLAERFNIKRHFNNVSLMLETVHPDVVHITTPPQSHYEIGKMCLEAGCNVFIEKPFTLNAGEAAALVGLAGSKKLKMTVGTDEQFSNVAVDMRGLVSGGYLGGPPVHMEAYYCYDLGDIRYARAFLGNKDHWLRMLPGQLMHNIISHGIAKIAEYMPGDDAVVIASGFTSGFLQKMGETELVDELRTVIQGVDKTTAYFTFSTQMRPLLREFRVYGPKNGLILDQNHHALIKAPGGSYKSYLDKFIPLDHYARQYRKNMWRNFRSFMSRDFHMKAGLKRLVGLFYRSIAEDTIPPIPYREILLTARIMDSIFDQVYGRRHE